MHFSQEPPPPTFSYPEQQQPGPQTLALLEEVIPLC
jgi:hypothetical protein